ncbi:hypothetical protein BD560DRAFT_389873 [Blakeslea trispora]|nr:hypothetical protein BD560DRAFT_389873 [Blakeslea trispora]
MDLARVACFSKEAIDLHLLESSISFQIHVSFVNIGFAITFFLTRLDHDGLYVMYEVAHLEFPSSLTQLPVFTNLKNLNIFLSCYLYAMSFGSSVKSLIYQVLCRTSVKLTDLIDSTDPTKDRDRSCPIRF